MSRSSTTEMSRTPRASFRSLLTPKMTVTYFCCHVYPDRNQNFSFVAHGRKVFDKTISNCLTLHLCIRIAYSISCISVSSTQRNVLNKKWFYQVFNAKYWKKFLNLKILTFTSIFLKNIVLCIYKGNVMYILFFF